MAEINYENYCITCDVYDKLYCLGTTFINEVKTKIKENYNPFAVSLKRLEISDVIPGSYNEIEIKYCDGYGDTNDTYSFCVNAKLLIEDMDMCVSDFVDKTMEQEKLRQQRAKAEREERQKKIDMEEYQRIKEKYSL